MALLLAVISLRGQASDVRTPRGDRAAFVELRPDRDRVALWPAVTIWTEPGPELSPGEALVHLADFRTPESQVGNLGTRSGGVWLHVPLQVMPGADRRWIFELDYPSIDRMELYVRHDGHLSRPVRLGDHLPREARPLQTRNHASEVLLPAGQTLSLLMRVQTQSSMVLPLALVDVHRYQQDESRVLLVQGLMLGVVWCFLTISLVQWWMLRDAVYLWYALSLIGSGSFFLSFFGVGPQFLWPDLPWLIDNASLLFVLMALAGGALFIDCTLETAQRYPWVSWALRATAGLTAVLCLAFCVGVIEYRTAQFVAMSLGPMPMLLGVPVAWIRARQGDVAARFIFLGWVLYTVGVVSMILLILGRLPGNFWTQHAFQFSSMAEMATWMLVLGARTDTLRRQAEAVAREHDRMRYLAHTDPLTGLLNRRGLDESLGERLSVASPQAMVAYFELDLDGFKPVNDRHGHDVGDALLVAVGQRLKSALRGHQDLVARTGGDEFVIVTTGLADARWAEHIGQKLLRLFQAPFEVEGRSCRVGATIGYALSPVDGSEVQVLMRRADEALYAGKAGGRNQVRRANP